MHRASLGGLAGGTIYLVAKLVKAFVQRGRPQTLLADVCIFAIPDRGLGSVSGHSAVAVALATVASPFPGSVAGVLRRNHPKRVLPTASAGARMGVRSTTSRRGSNRWPSPFPPSRPLRTACG